MANRFLNNIRINDEYTLPASDGTADQVITTDGAGQLSFVDQSTINAGNAEHVVIYAKNTSGSTINKGTPVYITGTVGATDTVEIAPADAGNSAKMPAVGLLDDTLANNAFGYVITGGFMDNITTDPIDGTTPSSNDTVYVKAGGGLTMTKPTGASNLIQNIAKVGKVSGGNAGSLVVSSILRTNDVPNLTTGKIWVGSSTYTTESGVVHLDESNVRMGIGTTSPSYKLDVSGNANDGIRLAANNALIGGGADGGDTQLLYWNGSTAYYGRSSLGGSVTQHEFRTSGATRMLINSSGNVGIGTTSPQEKLDISAGSIRLDDNQRISWASTDANIGRVRITGSEPNDFIAFVTDNSERMRLTNTGLGIGTTSPTNKLDVIGTLSATDIRVGSTASGEGIIRYNGGSGNGIGIVTGSLNSSSIGLFVDHSANNRSVGIGTTSPNAKLTVDGESSSRGIELKRTGTLTGNAYLRLVGVDTQEALSFNVNDGEKVRITYNGNVGIGVTSPQTELHVRGTNGWGEARIEGQTFASGHGGSLEFYSEGTALADIYASTTKELILRTNGTTEAMRIDSSGNVGIGTDNPEFKLHVRDQTSYGGIKVSGNNAPGITIEDDSDDAYSRIVAQNGGELRISADVPNLASGFIAFRTAGDTERMRIDSSGRILINATSTIFNDKLYINNDAYTSGGWRVGTSSTYVGKLYNSSGILTLESDSSRDIQFGSSTYGTKMYIDTSSGNVGIGETSPLYSLDVNSGADNTIARFLSSDDVGQIQISDNDTDTWIGSKNGLSYISKTAGTPVDGIVIDNSNNVGIGTITPSGKFNSYISATRQLTHNGNGGDLSIISDNNSTPVFYVKGTGTADLVNVYDNTNEVFTIKDGGNVGIGTTGPQALLDVGGGDGTPIGTQFRAVIKGTNTRTLYLDSDGSAASMWWGSGNTPQFALDSTSGGGAQFWTYSGGWNRRMDITASGNVGIGTTAPGGKLDVAGTITSRPGSSSSSALSIGVLEITTGGTPTQIKITTNIPYSGAGATTHAHSVTIRGFQYGNANTVDLQISWHVYNNSFYNRAITSSGGWAPTVRLAVENNKVVIHLASPGYWPKMYVESLYNAYGSSAHAQGWSWSDAAISADANTPNELVPYKINFGNSFLMDSSGNVGIGTTSPQSILHIADANPEFILEDTTNPNKSRIRNVDGNLRYDADYNGELGNSRHQFFIDGSEKLRIDTDGNIGIGTTSPQTKLHIAGSTDASVIRLENTSTGLSQGDTIGAIQFYNNDTTDDSPNIAASIYATAGPSGGSGYLSFRTKEVGTEGAAATATMTLTNGGNVGIGTTTPGEKLDVAGNIKHTGLTMTDGTDVDQLKTFSMTYQLSADTWTDTGINGSDLSTGTYAMQVYADDHNAGGQQYDEYYSATISWFGTGTNSTIVDEIVVHRAGHAPNANDLQFRTVRHSTGGDDLMLQVKANLAHTATMNGTDGRTHTYKFRRLI